MFTKNIKKTKMVKSILFVFCTVLAVDMLFFAGTGTLPPKAEAAVIADSDRNAENPGLPEVNTGVNTDVAADTGADAAADAEAGGDKPITDASRSERDASEQVVFQAAKERGLLILVNKQNALPTDYKPDDLVTVEYFAENREKICSYLRAEARDYFHKLIEAADEAGYTMMMTSGYRSYGYQQVLWDDYIAAEGEEAANKYSAKPGESEHQTGLAIDVTSPGVGLQLVENFGDTSEGKWLAKNAHSFGFIVRYPKGKESITGYNYEPWHIRYVGKDVATEIYKKGITLEEYLTGNY